MYVFLHVVLDGVAKGFKLFSQGGVFGVLFGFKLFEMPVGPVDNLVC
jgi:hypothetical protein